MSYQIFVRNVAPVVTAQDLAELFSAYGRVIDVKRPFDQKKQQPQLYAFVKMSSDEEAAAAIVGLTGHPIGGMELDVRKAEAPAERKPDGDRPPRAERPERGDRPPRAQKPFKPGAGGKRPPGPGGPKKAPKKPDPVRDAIWKRALEIAEILGETEKRPRAQIARIIELKAPEYADALLQDTHSLENAGGMLTLDGERRRTLGGIFFKLAKDRLDEATRQEIFPNWRELKRRAEERKAKEKAAAEAEKRATGSRPTAGLQAPAPLAPKRTVTKPKVTIPASPGGANTPAPAEVREELNRLREAERAAQQRLSDIKSKRVKGGMLEAMKEVADLKARILQILQAYPSLK